jgi:hypothetical protein
VIERPHEVPPTVIAPVRRTVRTLGPSHDRLTVFGTGMAAHQAVRRRD